MRHLSNLVPCQPLSSADKKKAEVHATAMPVNRQQQRLGRDHSVLLTIVGDSSVQRASSHSQPPPVTQPCQQSQQNIMAPSFIDQFMGDPIPVMDGSMAIADDIPDCPNFVDDGHSPVKIDRFNLLSVKQFKKVCKSPSYWHKVTILRGAGYTKLEIMRAVFDHIHPALLGVGPCKFRREGSSVSFLVKNCVPALLKLFNPKEPQVLKVQFNGPNGPEVHYLDLELFLRHTPVKDLRLYIYENLSACLSKRYDKNLRMLDLSAFHDDPDLSESIFWPLWIPKALMFVRNFAGNKFPNCRWLNLSNNELTELPPKGFFLPKLEVLDLSCNKLADRRALLPLKGSTLVDIVLDRNPLCATFPDEPSYIQCLKEFFPCIKRIDGVYLMRPELPVWRRHFVLLGQPELVALVDQFLQHFFTLLDGDDRQRLRGMYHPDAMFSLTCNYVPGQSTSSTARLTRYTLESRNLLKLSDYSKSQQLLSQGAEEVLSALGRLPRTEHDPYSFAVDMPYYTQDLAMIVVNGVFREPSVMNEKLIRAFSRTFVLRKVASKEYQIINEMLTVSNAATKQAEDSFQYPRPKVSLAKLSFNPAQDLTDADRQQMTKIFSRLTEMNQRWSRKCLEESKWDIKEALLVFTELLKMEKFPGEAFDLEEDRVGEKK